MTSYQIEGPWRGELAIVPRPRGGDWLEDEIQALKDAGFDLVVSLLTTEETEELALTNEAELSQAQGLQFCNFPIPDYGVPDSRKFMGELDGALWAGKKIAIHCRGGIGRSGMVASGLLVLSGLEPETAFRQVSTARKQCVPETDKQKDWVRKLSRESIETAVRR